MLDYNYEKMTFREMMQLFNEVKYCRLATADNNQPYAIPMYFKYIMNGRKIKFILRSRDNGLKMRFMDSNNRVALEFDTQGDGYVESVVVLGRVKIYDDPNGYYATIEVLPYKITGRRYLI